MINRLGKTVHKLTGANDFTLYFNININILTGEDERYYAGLNLLYQTLLTIRNDFN